MTENTSFSFGDAVEAALADYAGEGTSELDSNEAIEAEVEETLEEDNSEVEEEVVADAEVDADEEVEEADEDAEAEEEDEGSDLVTLGEDDEVVIDGETVKVKDALLRQADYTKKTQALAEERKAFEAEKEGMLEAFETMSSLDEAWNEDPSSVVATFLSNAEDAADTVGDAVIALASEGDVDPNLFLVRTILRLVSNDQIDEELREMLGFDDETVARAKEQSKQENRIAKLEREVRAPKKVQASDEQEYENAKAALAQQWNDIVEADENLSAMELDAQLKVRSEVAKLAIERGGIPLDVAYELLQAKQAKLEADAVAKKAAVTSKKRATKSVSKPSNGSGSAPAPTRNPSDLDSIIADAYRELGG